LIRDEGFHRLVGDDNDGDAYNRNRDYQRKDKQSLILPPLLLTTLPRFACAALLCHVSLPVGLRFVI